MSEWSKIVVGVDGSECSQAALRWAAAEARRHDADLFPITAVAPPVVIYPYGRYPAGLEPDAAEAARPELDRVVADVLGENPGIKVHPAVHRGNPAKVLIDLSEQADVVVVGTRGRGGFAGKLLGSVSRDVATHAACTAVIVRERRRPASPT